MTQHKTTLDTNEKNKNNKLEYYTRGFDYQIPLIPLKYILILSMNLKLQWMIDIRKTLSSPQKREIYLKSCEDGGGEAVHCHEYHIPFHSTSNRYNNKQSM